MNISMFKLVIQEVKTKLNKNESEVCIQITIFIIFLVVENCAFLLKIIKEIT